MENKIRTMQEVRICLSNGDDIDCYLLDGCPTNTYEHIYWIFTQTDRKIIDLKPYYMDEVGATSTSQLIQHAREHRKKYKDHEGFIYYTPIELIKASKDFYRVNVFYPRERYLINVHHIKYIKYLDTHLLMNDDQMTEFLTADMRP